MATALESSEGYAKDPESLLDEQLEFGLSPTENSLRWGFVRKVYSIISLQLVLTLVVCTVNMASQEVQEFVASGPGRVLLYFALAFSFLGLLCLYCYKHRHPFNLILLSFWTMSISLALGVACASYTPVEVVKALAITAAVVVALAGYAFNATRKGKSFEFMGPVLFASLLGLIVWGFFQAFFPVGPIGRSIYAGFGAVVFAGYIVFDTWLLISRYDLDDYIWASVNLYLDIVNSFLRILEMLGKKRS